MAKYQLKVGDMFDPQTVAREKRITWEEGRLMEPADAYIAVNRATGRQFNYAAAWNSAFQRNQFLPTPQVGTSQTDWWGPGLAILVLVTPEGNWLAIKRRPDGHFQYIQLSGAVRPAGLGGSLMEY